MDQDQKAYVYALYYHYVLDLPKLEIEFI